MPEGPEVRKIADVLEKAVGHYIIDFWANADPKYKFCREGVEGSKLFHDRKPLKIEKIVVKGKLIRIDLEQDISVLNTLGMSGTWKNGTLTSEHSRAMFLLGDSNGVAYDASGADHLVFCDQRSFGNLKVVTRQKAIEAIKAIGWDLLQAPMPSKSWLTLQQKRYFKEKEIGPALMEQKEASGIGNIYKAEILHELKINPATKVKDVDPQIWVKINTTAHKILKTSYSQGGSSVRNYSAGGRKGTYQNALKIYSKKQCPLGHDTAKLKQKSRNTWYCPKCQK